MANGAYPNKITDPKAAVPTWDAGGSFSNYSANNAGAQIKLGAGVLQRLVINTAGLTSQVAFYDGTSSAMGTLIGTYSTLAQGHVEIGAQFTTGLFAVVTGGTPANITVIFH